MRTLRNRRLKKIGMRKRTIKNTEGRREVEREIEKTERERGRKDEPKDNPALTKITK